jgi:hypothetical protein
VQLRKIIWCIYQEDVDALTQCSSSNSLYSACILLEKQSFLHVYLGKQALFYSEGVVISPATYFSLFSGISTGGDARQRWEEARGEGGQRRRKKGAGVYMSGCIPTAKNQALFEEQPTKW